MTSKSPPNLPETGYLRLPQILQLIPIGRSTWWQGVKDHRFPQPVKLGPRTTAWKAEDIRQLLNEINDHNNGSLSKKE